MIHIFFIVWGLIFFEETELSQAQAIPSTPPPIKLYDVMNGEKYRVGFCTTDPQMAEKPLEKSIHYVISEVFENFTVCFENKFDDTQKEVNVILDKAKFCTHEKKGPSGFIQRWNALCLESEDHTGHAKDKYDQNCSLKTTYESVSCFENADDIINKTLDLYQAVEKDELLGGFFNHVPCTKFGFSVSGSILKHQSVCLVEVVKPKIIKNYDVMLNEDYNLAFCTTDPQDNEISRDTMKNLPICFEYKPYSNRRKKVYVIVEGGHLCDYYRKYSEGGIELIAALCLESEDSSHSPHNECRLRSSDETAYCVENANKIINKTLQMHNAEEKDEPFDQLFKYVPCIKFRYSITGSIVKENTTCLFGFASGQRNFPSLLLFIVTQLLITIIYISL